MRNKPITMASHRRKHRLQPIKFIFPKRVEGISTKDYVAQFCKLNHLINN